MIEANGQTSRPDAVTRKPLAGIRVIELANHLAAPTASMYLGDYGAEIIKVEAPVIGDELRRWGRSKDGVGLYFKVVNRNKKSVLADLRTPLGVEIVERLASTADVVVENFRPGTLARWHVDYESLKRARPDLIMLSVTGFGQLGPYSGRRGFGTLAEACTGYAYVNGFPDRPPLLPGFGLADAATGLMGAFLVLVALQARAAGAGGQLIDLALYETLYTLLGPHVVDFDQLGVVQQRAGSRLPFAAPRNTYETRDGKWVAIAGSTQLTFEKICAALGLSDLCADERFATNELRLLNVDALDNALARAVKQLSLSDLEQRFQRLDAPVAPVYRVDQTLDDPHFVARAAFVGVHDDELGGPMRMQNIVGRLSVTPGSVDSTGPELGAHTREILVEELGMDEVALIDAGILRP